MKLLTTNFLTCAVKTCKSSPLSFPLHFKDATLERTEVEYNPLFVRNIIPRVNWEALMTTAGELGLTTMVPEREVVEGMVEKTVAETEREGQSAMELEKEGPVEEDEILKKLHTLLLETGVVDGKLVCGNCQFEYPIKEGVGNFLLPAHLV